MVERGRKDAIGVELHDRSTRSLAPARVETISRSTKSSASSTARWWASAMIACVPASVTAHKMLADFGIENVMSNPATACLRLPIWGWA